MKKVYYKKDLETENKINLVLFRMRKSYPNLYRDAGARYIRFILKKVNK